MYGLTRSRLDEYIIRSLRQAVSYARGNSIFYNELLKNYTGPPGPLTGSTVIHGSDIIEVSNGRRYFDDMFMKWFRTLPFTNPRDLLSREKDFLCVSPADISRIVTLNTGGTTARPKRIYFTEEDQQLTVDYFKKGMQWIVGRGDRVLILMPAKIPGSVGRLLAKGLEGFGAEPFTYGLPELTDIPRLISLIEEKKINSVVAIPSHMKALADAVISMRNGDVCRKDVLKLDSVLLSGDYVSPRVAEMVQQTFGCKVFEHYGMTEMGLGCAVSCGFGEGYHIREKDLYIEIINPKTGRTIENDEAGEIVFTTLTRKGMPFIRYRTGDISSWIKSPCSCGSILKRISKVGERNETKGYLRKGEKNE